MFKLYYTQFGINATSVKHYYNTHLLPLQQMHLYGKSAIDTTNKQYFIIFNEKLCNFFYRKENLAFISSFHIPLLREV